jgi:hypothetical protein
VRVVKYIAKGQARRFTRNTRGEDLWGGRLDIACPVLTGEPRRLSSCEPGELRVRQGSWVSFELLLG